VKRGISSSADRSADAARRLLIVTIAVTAMPTTHMSRKSDGTGPTLAEVESVESGSSISEAFKSVKLMVKSVDVSATTCMGVRPTASSDKSMSSVKCPSTSDVFMKGWVGDVEGADEGDSVGDMVGLAVVGCMLGDTEGDNVGDMVVGDMVVGCMVVGCMLVGCMVVGDMVVGCMLVGCMLVGCMLGDIEGDKVGDIVVGDMVVGCMLVGCMLVGCMLGDTEGDTVGDMVGAVRDPVGETLAQALPRLVL
jgi:hypothetical protein